MVFNQKKWLWFLFTFFLFVNIVLLVWLKLTSSSSPNNNPPVKPAKKILSSEVFFLPSGNDKSSFVGPGYFIKNMEGGAVVVGILESVNQKGNEIIANFSFGNQKKPLKMDFVVGLIEPKTVLHLSYSKTQDLFPISKNFQIQQIEPKEIVFVLRTYIGKPFRLSLSQPYSEEEIRKSKAEKKVIEEIKILNLYLDCNRRLIDINNQGVLSQLVDCRPAVFDLLIYDANI